MARKVKEVVLVSNGDFRDSAGVESWPMQKETLRLTKKAFAELNVKTTVYPKYNAKRGHGFLTKQCEGAALFAKLDPNVPVVIVLSCWAYAHHVSSCLQTHKGPILLLANFDGTWPGLVALLNHAATLERLSIPHSRLWSTTFTDDKAFMKKLRTWVSTGTVEHDMSHVVSADKLTVAAKADQFGKDLAADIIKRKRIMGQLDPGCMGMLNAVLSPDKIGQIGMPVELLNQSDLLAEMKLVSDEEAQGHLNWLVKKGARFHWGTDQFNELVHGQVIEQMKMYSAAARIYNRYGLSAIGIPYQYGLVRSTAASDLAEGMLNNSDRPAVKDPETGEIINRGRPIVHFNEGDMGAGIPQVLMHDIYARRRMPPETTLHDVRWGAEVDGKFVWVLEISGAAPAAHFGGWKKTEIYRQPKMYFPLGGGTCAGVCKPGTITWARFYERFGDIGMDCGTGEVIELPDKEVTMRRESTTKEWPIANVYIPGYGRDQLMASHMSNHIVVGYGDILQELIATCRHLGIPTRVAGDVKDVLK